MLDGVTTTLHLLWTRGSAGTPLPGVVTLINRTGAPIRSYSCRNTLVTAMLRGLGHTTAEDVPAGTCTRPYFIPVGRSRYAFTIATRFQPALAPLPAGTYAARLQPLSISLPVPAPLPVTLTPATANVDRLQPPRCALGPGGDLAAAADAIEGPGFRFYRFTDTGSRPCLLVDAPQLQLDDGHGQPLRTVGYIENGGAGPSAPLMTITLQPGHPMYLSVFGLLLGGFGSHPPAHTCPTSATLAMSFRYSPGHVIFTGQSGEWSTYEQLGGRRLACGLLDMVPLSPVKSDAIATAYAVRQ